MKLLLIFLLIMLMEFSNGNYVENYYCGETNCYDLLEVTRDAPKADIKRAFRAIASKTHPDRFQNPDDKKTAEERFHKIQTAYDILRDDDARSDYDYMLDHPDQFYMNYYRAWRRRNAPNVDVRIVIAATISLISFVQYYTGWTKYEEAIKYFTTVPKYRIHATQLAKEDGLLLDKKKTKGMTKEQIKEQEEKVIRQIIESKMDIRGVYAKPTWKDILWIQLLLLPYWGYQYVAWYCCWVWMFNIKKMPYGDEEKLYIIRKNLKMGQGQFDALEENVVDDYYDQELWIKENFTRFKLQKDQQIKSKMAQSAKYRAYRRYMKNNGPGRMYFDDS